METKKDVGVMSLSAPIPSLRLSHCLQIRISNVKPAHVRDIYNYTYYHLTQFSHDNLYTQRHHTQGWGYTLLYIREESKRRDRIEST